MSESKYVIQFIDSNNGSRSEPFVSSFGDLHKTLTALDDEMLDWMMVLILAPVADGGQGEFSRAPIVRAKTFIEWFNNVYPSAIEKEESNHV